MKAMLYGLLVVLLSGGGLLWWIDNDYHSPGPLERPVTLVFPLGTHFEDIADQLEKANIIVHPTLFKLQVVLRGANAHFKAGEYAFTPDLSPQEVVEILTSGKVVKRQLTIPEGLMTVEILELVKKEAALSGEITLSPSEGELLPETYFYSYGDKRNEIIQRMKTGMQKVLDEAWATKAEGLPVTTKEQAVTLASIVEKETALADERPHVASVYVNRLRKGMLLQADPTTAYAITKGKAKMDRPLVYSDLVMDSPYNTYRTVGLPPGPIANPGKASINAALHPASTEDIYFVANGKGGHNFAKTMQEHEENVRKYRAWQRANDNKSDNKP